MNFGSLYRGAMALAGAAALSAASADVVINEVQSANDTTFSITLQKSGWTATDEPDWIELYNSGKSEVDLAGWTLTEVAEKPTVWTFPDGARIEANGYLILIADGRTDEEDVTPSVPTHYHVPMSISTDGETLALASKDGSYTNRVSFGMLPCDASCGFGADGKPNAYYAKATPLRANSGTAYGAPLGPVRFSHERGLFTTGEKIELTLDHDDPDAQIYYTTDHSDPSATNGVRYVRGTKIGISKTTIVRATAEKAGALPYRNITAHSYIYPDQVMQQQKPACAADVWQDNGKCNAWYGISQSVVYDEEMKSNLVASLKAAPIVSFTLSDQKFFDPKTGLHSKPWGSTKEEPVSLEWVSGADSNLVFGLQCGVKMQGGWGRKFAAGYTIPKKSFQLKFRKRYGKSKLGKRVMTDAGYEDRTDFKSLILRAEFHGSWTGDDSECHCHGKDQFCRDLQRVMHGYNSGGTHVHLFINGLYWGLYNLVEHVDEHLPAKFFGGEGDDYVMAKPQSETVSGDGSQYWNYANAVWEKAFNNDFTGVAEMSRKECYDTAKAFLDMDCFMSYMLFGYWNGNWDWPNNNWMVFGIPNKGLPFRYFVWDCEGAFDADIEYSRIHKLSTDNRFRGNPGHLAFAFERSPEYRLKIADKFDEMTQAGNVLDENVQSNLYLKLVNRMRPLMFAESARWGAYKHELGTDPERASNPVYRVEDWWGECNRILDTFIPQRVEILRNQLKGACLYPSNALPPVVTVSADGKRATIAPQAANAGAAIYYTTDGSDPCDPWGATAAAQAVGARYAAGTEIAVEARSTLKARVLLANGEWSTLATAKLKGSAIEWNEFARSENGKQWGKASNWSLGEVPNGSGAAARIGVPTEVNAKNGWRNVHVDEQTFTVGHVDVACGGMTNRLDSGDAPGGLTFDGGDTNATFTVSDAAGAGLAMIDMDGVVKLASDIVFDVRNPAGDATYGALWAKGDFDGNGRTLVKAGAGKMTFGFAGATNEHALGAIRLEGGELAVYKRLHVSGVISGAEGTILSLEINTNDTGVAEVRNVTCAALDVPAVRLFLKSSNPGVYVGGCWAAALPPCKKVSVYAPRANGAFSFKDGRYAKVDAPTLSVVERDGRKTYRVVYPTPMEPMVVDETGGGAVIERQDGDYVVTEIPASLRELEIAGAGAGLGGRVVVPADTVETIRGVPADKLALKVNGIAVDAACFVGGGEVGFSTALKADVVRPAIAEDENIVEPFRVEGGVEVTIKPVPGLRYTLLRGETPDAVTEEAESEVAKQGAAALSLTDSKPPAKKAFYRVRVSK